MSDKLRLEARIGPDYMELLEERMDQFNSPDTDKNANTIRERIQKRDMIKKELGWDLKDRGSFMESAIAKMDSDIKEREKPWISREFGKRGI